MKSFWKTTFFVLFLPMLGLVLTQCASVPAKKVVILADYQDRK